jgi:TetR/AcrR family transcriptional regulator
MKSQALRGRRPGESPDRPAQIVDAAMGIIATQGSRRFTAQVLAAEIGVTPGALFRHFPSMEAIVDAVVERTGAILEADFPRGVSDPLERLEIFFRNRTRTIVAHPQLSHLLLSDHLAQAGGPAQERRLKEFKKRSAAFVVGCLREAREAGTLEPGTSPAAGAVLVLGSVLSLAHSSVQAGEAARVEKLSTEVWAAIQRALRIPGPDGQSGRPTRRPSRPRSARKE